MYDWTTVHKNMKLKCVFIKLTQMAGLEIGHHVAMLSTPRTSPRDINYFKMYRFSWQEATVINVLDYSLRNIVILLHKVLLKEGNSLVLQ